VPGHALRNFDPLDVRQVLGDAGDPEHAASGGREENRSDRLAHLTPEALYHRAVALAQFSNSRSVVAPDFTGALSAYIFQESSIQSTPLSVSGIR